MKDLGCAIEKKLAQLQEAIDNQKTQMHSNVPSSGASLAFAQLSSEMFNKINGSSALISQSIERGSVVAQDFLQKVQENIKERPWDVVRQVAVCSFAAGLFLSLRQRKHNNSGNKE